MANEFRKVIDTNNLVHPVCDDTRVDWENYAETGAVNMFNYEKWKGIHVQNGTGNFINNGVDLTSTANDCYTGFDANNFPAKIYVNPGDKIKLTWDLGAGSASGTVIMFADGVPDSSTWVRVDNTEKKIDYTVPAGTSFVTFRLGVATSGNVVHYKNIMVTRNEVPVDVTKYIPYAMTNRELTEQLPLGLLEMIKLTKLWGANNANNALDIDKINNGLGYMYRIQSGTALTGTEPSGIGNGYLVIGFSGINQTSELPQYGVQVAFGFGGDKIAFRRASYSDAGSAWGAWKYLTLT